MYVKCGYGVVMTRLPRVSDKRLLGLRNRIVYVHARIFSSWAFGSSLPLQPVLSELVLSERTKRVEFREHPVYGLSRVSFFHTKTGRLWLKTRSCETI